MNYHLSFTIGPVQAFVAQARRTRDFWSGSWLLSYLAESALAAAEQAGGTAVIPFRSDDARKKIASATTAVDGVPNRFELSFNSEDAENAAIAAGNAATKAFEDAWQKVADAVWNRFLSLHNGSPTAEIWNRQVASFWEVSWVVGQVDGDQQTLGRLTAARKNFRNVHATPEHGVKCALMPTFQELSGTSNSTAMNKFWDGLNLGLNLRETERLCAIALIKRLLPEVSKTATGIELKTRSWPSTAFMAALPWLKKLHGEDRQLAQTFAERCVSASIDQSELNAAKDTGISWAKVDGPAWFATALSKNEWGVPEEKCKALQNQLKALHQQTGPPVPYYAMVIMDGDRLGRLLQELDGSTALSECLADFTSKVADTVADHDGRTIYAGGDDVLAIAPATSALKIATELSLAYGDCFQKDGQPIKSATISAAIVYAHWTYPLRQVLKHAHRLLDDVAKNQTGRDALAIGIIQGSGLNAQWSAPWSAVRGEVADYPRLEDVIDRFSSDDKSKETTDFNASFLYHLREQFARLFAEPVEKPGAFGKLPKELSPESTEAGHGVFAALANAEFRRRMKSDQRKEVNAMESLEQLTPLMKLSQRASNADGGCPGGNPRTFGFDGWRVARFLKSIQDGEVVGHDRL